MAEQENGSSPLAEALARVSDRWTLLVVEALLGGPQRFNDLPGQIPGIAPNILSERLNERSRRRQQHVGGVARVVADDLSRRAGPACPWRSRGGDGRAVKDC